MGLFRFAIKTCCDVPSWMGLKQLKSQTGFLINNIKPIFKARKITASQMTFDQKIAEWNIDNAHLDLLMNRFIYHSLIYLILGFLCVGYAFYLFLHQYTLSGITTILIAIIIFLKAFSTHFWYFEIKHRKLGCTLREWLNGKIKD